MNNKSDTNQSKVVNNFDDRFGFLLKHGIVSKSDYINVKNYCLSNPKALE